MTGFWVESDIRLNCSGILPWRSEIERKPAIPLIILDVLVAATPVIHDLAIVFR